MEISLFVALAAGAWFWFDSIGARETAIRLGRDLAERCNLQLLDETVACSKLRIGRNRLGRAQLVLLGSELQSWHIPPYLQPLH